MLTVYTRLRERKWRKIAQYRYERRISMSSENQTELLRQCSLESAANRKREYFYQRLENLERYLPDNILAQGDSEILSKLSYRQLEWLESYASRGIKRRRKAAERLKAKIEKIHQIAEQLTGGETVRLKNIGANIISMSKRLNRTEKEMSSLAEGLKNVRGAREEFPKKRMNEFRLAIGKCEKEGNQPTAETAVAQIVTLPDGFSVAEWLPRHDWA